MMYVCEPSPVFMEYNGVKIYYVYSNDMESDGTRNYIFGLNEWCSDDDSWPITFDVRDIEGFDRSISLKENLRRMIDAGLLENVEDEE